MGTYDVLNRSGKKWVRNSGTLHDVDDVVHFWEAGLAIKSIFFLNGGKIDGTNS